MQRIWSIALPILLVSICGCGQIRESWETCAEAARDLHRGDAQALCRRFSETMLSALPCHAMERVLRQTVAAVGEPVGECRWAYTYRIQTLDPLRAAAVYKCPFAHETVKVTVAVTDRATVEPAELEVESPYGTWTVTVGLNGEEREPFRFEVVRGEAGD